MKKINKKYIAVISAVILVMIAGLILINGKNSKKKALEDGLKTGEWLITQYSDATGEQASVYTLSTKDRLVIIDGGWQGNSSVLRDIIKKHDNHVDAWIISHPHRDHAGAFIDIMSAPDGIMIDSIYDNNYDYEFVMSVGEPYDDITIMEKFYKLTHDSDKLIHMRRDEEYDICGLKVKVLNSFDEAVKENVGEERDYQNNASLCLRITNTNESFLYTADIKKDMKDYLYKNYGDYLKADYVQLSHHGNWGLTKKLYDKTGADIFFLDAPADISDNESYPAYDLKKYLLEQGKKVYDFETAPNTVILK